MKAVTFLSFPGNCEAALRFYEKALGAEVLDLIPYRGSPLESKVPAQLRDRILYALVKVGDNTLMAADRVGQTGSEGMSGFALVLNAETPAEAERLIAALAAGGRITQPLEETFWALRFGMVVDSFGVPWMINCSRPASSPGNPPA